ncbi:MAG: class I SAM-dependent methyltransferase [Paludibacter sp.]|nr:class I SAM-dependent methyltransferase [Paludibacter sp.]
MNTGKGSDEKNRSKPGPESSAKEVSRASLPDWNSIYREMNIEDMPWYLPELDPDLKTALEEYQINSGSFLDLGTGPGTQAIELSKRGFEVTGVDISVDAIRKAQKLTQQVTFIQDDILNPRINRQFDFIFDRGCFHIIDRDKRTVYLSEVLKLLNEDGMFFLKCFSDKNPDTGYGPYHISREMIDSLFNKHFNILKIEDSIYQSISSQQNKTLFVVMKKKNI